MMKKYTNIIIITIYPLSERDYLRFGIDTFLENGFSVVVWDIACILSQNVADVEVPNKKEYLHYKQIRDVYELNSELSKYSPENCLIIMYCSILYRVLNIYWAIKKHSLDYAVVNLGNLPCVNPPEDNSFFPYAKIIRYIKLISVRAVCDKLISLIPNKYYWLLGITPAKYYLAGGLIALKSVPAYYISDKTTVINAHSMDYDRYLEMDPSKPAYLDKLTKYCVFIDEYFPYHPDYAVAGVKPPCSENKYYPSLNKFFDYVEKKFNLPVIIAAHPRADYNSHPKAYPYRTIISGQTNYLVRDAEFVIMHSSTAISYAALFKKAILFITTDELKENNDGLYDDAICTFARFFGKAPINTDGDYSSLCEIPDIDEKLYEKYINDYIKMKNTPKKKIWEIFIDEIEKH